MFVLLNSTFDVISTQNGKRTTVRVLRYQRCALITTLKLFPFVFFPFQNNFTLFPLLTWLLSHSSTPRIPLHMLRARRLSLIEYLHFQHAQSTNISLFCLPAVASSMPCKTFVFFFNLILHFLNIFL